MYAKPVLLFRHTHKKLLSLSLRQKLARSAGKHQNQPEILSVCLSFPVKFVPPLAYLLSHFFTTYLPDLVLRHDFMHDKHLESEIFYV